VGLPGQRPSALPAGRHLAVPASWKGGLDRQVDWSLAPCPAGRWTWSAHPTPRPEAHGVLSAAGSTTIPTTTTNGPRVVLAEDDLL
jgi:hypothetical protein